MIAQTRQFPTISMTTRMECTVAMAMPDDWSMAFDMTLSHGLIDKIEIRMSEFLIAELVI